MGLQNWSTTPANNATGAPNINMATGSAPSTVHPSVRQMMADVAAWYADPEWVLQADTPTYTGTTTFTVPGNRTSTYSIGRRVQAIGTGYTINGTISASAYGTVTAVTVQWDSGALDNTVNAVAVGLLKGAAMVGFLQAGTGAVSRTVAAKLQESVSVLDFGADPTGVADIFSSLSAAVAAANGATVLFPQTSTGASYKLATAYTAPSGTRLFLESGAAFTSGVPAGASIQYELSQATAISGSVMAVDHLQEASTFGLKNEGGIWSGNAYAYFGVSKEMNSGTVGGGTANGAPLTTFFAFANNNGASGDVVAVLGDAVARQSNGVVFGGNLIARNVAGTTNTKLVGLEIDYEPAIGTTDASTGAGLVLNNYNIASNAPVANIGALGGGSWANGFGTSHIRGAHYFVNSGDSVTATTFINTANGTFSGGAIQLGTGAGQAINFGATAFGLSTYLYGDTSGNLLMNMGSGGVFAINNPAGALRFTFDQYGTLNMPNNGVVKINGVQVLAQQITGYGTPTGNVKTANFPGATATLLQTSEMLAQLIIDLKSHGLIGA